MSTYSRTGQDLTYKSPYFGAFLLQFEEATILYLPRLPIILNEFYCKAYGVPLFPSIG